MQSAWSASLIWQTLFCKKLRLKSAKISKRLTDRIIMSVEDKLDEIIVLLTKIEGLLRNESKTDSIQTNVAPKTAKTSVKTYMNSGMTKPQVLFKIKLNVSNHFNEQQLFNHIKTHLDEIIKRRIKEQDYLPQVQLQSKQLIQEEINKTGELFYTDLKIYNIQEERKINNKAKIVFKRAVEKRSINKSS